MTGEDEAKEGYVRLFVPLDWTGGEGPEYEWLWAEPLGTNRYRVESSPFFAYGLSYDDVVLADPGGEGENGVIRVGEVERKSGHRTLRVALDVGRDLDSPEVQKFLESLVEIGCTYEGLPPKLVSLDVPPEIDVEVVVGHLQAMSRERVLIWEWADPRPS
jgi:hypothetical protein